LIRLFKTFAILGFILLPLTGCLFRTHTVKQRVSNAKLQTATLPELLDRINSEAEKVKTLNATVDFATSVGGEKKGKVTDFQEIRGYILIRKPAMLRMIGLFPVVRNRAFDMVSNGDTFKLSIPAKNKFIIGTREVSHPSKNPLENLRPQHIMDALLVRAIDPQREIAVLESGSEEVRDEKSKKEVLQPNYMIDVIRREDDGSWALSRKIFISRIDLLPTKQVVYDRFGGVATEASYANFDTKFGVNFPNVINIERPQEEYSVQIAVVKLKLNEPLKDEQFDLPVPAGVQVQHLDEPKAAAAVAPKQP
jgi:outer membrane lipoprotein-sorting protein